MKSFQKLIAIARRKVIFDKTNEWAQGSSTYLREIQKEIQEVIEEIPQGCPASLEDELADVLWDYLNLVLALEQESNIQFDSVLERAAQNMTNAFPALKRGLRGKKSKRSKKLRSQKNVNSSLDQSALATVLGGVF